MIFNVTSGGGVYGASLTVTGPAGVTASVSKGSKTKSKTTDSAGKALFQGLESGVWTVTITDGTQTASRQVTVTSDYTAALTFFSARIQVTYPAGSTCTCSNGSAALTAPDTSGSAAFDVDSAGNWTVTISDGSRTASEVVSITADGQSVTLDITYGTALYNRGQTCDDLTGGWDPVPGSGYGYTFQTDRVDYASKSTVNVFGSLYTVNKIDLTDYTVLKAKIDQTEVTGTSAKSACITLTTDKTHASYQGVAYAGTAQTGEQVLELDISKYSSKYYVCFYGEKSKGSIYKIWLE